MITIGERGHENYQRIDFFIGENYQQQHNILKAEQFFKSLLKQLNHPDDLTLLASLREKNLNLQNFKIILLSVKNRVVV